MKWLSREKAKRFGVVQVMGSGTVCIEAGTVAHDLAMRAVEWGRPRGFGVTWMVRYNKPHLFKRL